MHKVTSRVGEDRKQRQSEQKMIKERASMVGIMLDRGRLRIA